MNHLKLLDKSLKFLNKHHHGSYVYYDKDSDPKHVNSTSQESKDKKDQLYYFFEKNNIEKKYRLPIIDHLIGDGFVKPHFDIDKTEEKGFPPHQIKITYKGISFISKLGGGYFIQRIKGVAYTGIVVVGIIVGAIWALYQLSDKIFGCCKS